MEERRARAARLFSEGRTQAEVARALQVRRQSVSRWHSRYSRPRILSSVFDWLKSRGVALALSTGFDRSITSLLVSCLQWETEVDAIVCGDEVKQGRSAPYLIFHAMEATGVQSVHHVANVGDTAVDLRAGYNAGVRWNIGVLSGAHDRQQLEKEPHTHLLPSVADLPEVVAPRPDDRQ
jgi:phosphonatase-like hydrolase